MLIQLRSYCKQEKIQLYGQYNRYDRNLLGKTTEVFTNSGPDSISKFELEIEAYLNPSRTST